MTTANPNDDDEGVEGESVEGEGLDGDDAGDGLYNVDPYTGIDFHTVFAHIGTSMIRKLFHETPDQFFNEFYHKRSKAIRSHFLL